MPTKVKIPKLTPKIKAPAYLPISPGDFSIEFVTKEDSDKFPVCPEQIVELNLPPLQFVAESDDSEDSKVVPLNMAFEYSYNGVALREWIVGQKPVNIVLTISPKSITKKEQWIFEDATLVALEFPETLYNTATKDDGPFHSILLFKVNRDNVLIK
jgi:hypothetical protein